VLQKPARRVKPTSAMFIEKYQWQLEEDQRYRVTQGIKRDRFFKARDWMDQREPQHTEEPRRKIVQHCIDQEPGIRQNPWFTGRSCSCNLGHRVNHSDVLCDREEPSWEQEQVKKHIMMVGSWLCAMSSEVHVNG
jgi:hypothetical protein